MPRISRKPKLPPPAIPIQRIRCSQCGRTWAAYQGAHPRMWTVRSDLVVCDRRSCQGALASERRAAQR